VREWHTDVGPADYVLFVDKKAVGVIEAKREEEGQRLTAHEPQTEGYAAAKLKWVNNQEPLPFLYESHRRHHPLYRWPRPQAALARNLQLPPPGNAARMAE
jgi:type I site-specific restriction endonuclease